MKIENDDSSLSDSHLLWLIINWRNRLVTENYRKSRSSDVNLIQDLGVVEMEEVDMAEDCNITAGCKILRSKLPLPRPVEIDDKPLITWIGGLKKIGNLYKKTSHQYQLVSWARLSWVAEQRWTSNLPYAAIKGGYLYVINKTGLAAINVQGIFEDPREASKYHSCEGTPCYSHNDKFPIDSGMIPLITELLFTKELALYAKTNKDLTNDNKDDNTKG
jgi:hypothetical protein